MRRMLALALPVLVVAACAHRPRHLKPLPEMLLLVDGAPFSTPDADGQVSRHLCTVPAFSDDSAVLNIAVLGGCDAANRRGLKVTLHSPHGKLLAEDSILAPNADGGWWIRDVSIIEGGSYVLRLVDEKKLVTDGRAAAKGKVQVKVFKER